MPMVVDSALPKSTGETGTFSSKVLWNNRGTFTPKLLGLWLSGYSGSTGVLFSAIVQKYFRDFGLNY